MIPSSSTLPSNKSKAKIQPFNNELTIKKGEKKNSGK